MTSFLSWVLFQGLGTYFLWSELKRARGEGWRVWNVYKGIGLNGSWGYWRVGQLEWKLVWCLWVLHAYTYILAQRIMGNLVGVLRSGHLFSNQLLVWKYCQDLCQALANSGGELEQ